MGRNADSVSWDKGKAIITGSLIGNSEVSWAGDFQCKRSPNWIANTLDTEWGELNAVGLDWNVNIDCYELDVIVEVDCAFSLGEGDVEVAAQANSSADVECLLCTLEVLERDH